MKYFLKAYLIHDIGQRANQEDAHYPPFIDAQHFDKVERAEAFYDATPHTEDSLFILCDGMGGHARGEVASNTVCEVMSKSITAAEKEHERFTDAMIHNAVKDALHALDALDDEAEERKMGTTMTLLKVHNEGVTIAHIGDSRVYHMRPSHNRYHREILFRTEDHSLANMLLHSGQITHQQLTNFPQRHVLTKAMQAGLKKPVEADIYHTKDILPGDIFFMCSDGVLEELYDDDLCAMLANAKFSDEERMQVLLSFCKDNQDNHTAWFVRVEKVETDDGKAVEITQPAPTPEKVGLLQRLKNIFKK